MPVKDQVEQYFLDNLNRFCALMSLSLKFYQSNPLNKSISLNVTPAGVLSVLSSLHAYRVEYLIVDRLAGVFYGHIRTSLNLTFWVKSSSINKTNLGAFLKQHKDDGIKLNFLEDLHEFKQADFDQCFTRAKTIFVDDIPFSLIDLSDLILDMGASMQLDDLADAEALAR
jgi:hypothetical protein